ncbi:MAG: hypothetical protein Q8O19_02175, partial [Rectinemataceae bacterium]|nr:hypothetical protein [Rectinemataceae bacterium]
MTDDDIEMGTGFRHRKMHQSAFARKVASHAQQLRDGIVREIGFAFKELLDEQVILGYTGDGIDSFIYQATRLYDPAVRVKNQSPPTRLAKAKIELLDDLNKDVGGL